MNFGFECSPCCGSGGACLKFDGSGMAVASDAEGPASVSSINGRWYAFADSTVLGFDDFKNANIWLGPYGLSFAATAAGRGINTLTAGYGYGDIAKWSGSFNFGQGQYISGSGSYASLTIRQPTGALFANCLKSYPDGSYPNPIDNPITFTSADVYQLGSGCTFGTVTVSRHSSKQNGAPFAVSSASGVTLDISANGSTNTYTMSRSTDFPSGWMNPSFAGGNLFSSAPLHLWIGPVGCYESGRLDVSMQGSFDIPGQTTSPTKGYFGEHNIPDRLKGSQYADFFLDGDPQSTPFPSSPIVFYSGQVREVPQNPYAFPTVWIKDGPTVSISITGVL